MCTNFHLVAEDNSIVVGRAMDYTMLFSPYFLIRKRRNKIPIYHSEKTGYLYSDNDSRYGYVGASVADLIPGISQHITMDGMNEVGLSAGFIYLRGTKYQKADLTNLSKNILVPFLCDWILAKCATVEDVKNKLPAYKVCLPIPFNEKIEQLVPLYVAVIDANGKSIVIEFIDREMNIIDNPVGVSTNEPTISWHFRNLDLYKNLSYHNPTDYKIGDLTGEPFAYSGLMGLPGDMTSPSRFIRVAYAKEFARRAKDSEQAYNLATHLLNMVDYPAGLTRFEDKGDSHQRWAVIKGLTSKVFAIRYFDNMSFSAIDLTKIDFSSVENKTIPVPKMPPFNFVDLSLLQ